MLFERQQYQEDCVANIADIIEKSDFFASNDISALTSAIKNHYSEKGYTRFKTSDKKRLDVLMETGTGKTFAYIKTIFELNRRFGQTKFIIIVPRSAIRLGVMQNIRLTDEYFYNEYKKHLNVIEYPKDGISRINSDFLNDSRLTVLILTNSSFNSAANVINAATGVGRLFHDVSTWNAIAAKRPVVIIDEPHLLKGDRTTEYLNDLKDSLFLRFGATFPDDSDEWHHLSNVAYTLDSVSSFNEYLVKKIRVNTLFTAGEEENFSVSAISGGKSFKMTYGINSQIHKKPISKGQDIGAVTGLSSFKGIHAVKITANKIFLSNGVTFDTAAGYILSDDEIREMINQTIRIHFEKEEALFNRGIKTLSLFFIPNVSDFRGDNPRIKKIFEEEYKKLRLKFYKSALSPEYKAFLDKDYADARLTVHEGYFSGDRGTRDEKEAAGVDLILNQKEKLLSFDTNLRFIFSVWALQEGWDNPNVFNICKISSTSSDTSRRQQAGRGLRIAVNMEGRRLTYRYLDEREHDFYDINTLDMLVSGREADFIEEIQREINEASFSFAGDAVTIELLISKGLNQREANHVITVLEDNGVISYESNSDNYVVKESITEYLTKSRESFTKLDDERYEVIKKIFTRNKTTVEDGNQGKKQVKIRPDKLKDFKQIWETINRKSKIVYKKIKEDELISNIVSAFNSEEIPPVLIRLERREYNARTDSVEFIKEETLGRAGYYISRGLESFAYRLIQKGAVSTGAGFSLPLSFALKLLNAPGLQRDKISANPSRAEELLRFIIKEEIHRSIVQGIDYEFENEINITPLQDKNGRYKEKIDYTMLGNMYSGAKAPDSLLYDTIVYDSNIEREIQQNHPAAIDEDKIVVFAKLPKISIPTPYKSYNPDFAYLIKRPGRKMLFLVVESKGYNSEAEIPPEEKSKITYGEKFFKRLQREMPDIQIEFKKWINKRQLADILKEIEKGA